MSLRVIGVLAITLNCLPACGQLVISTKSGLINYVEGEVLLEGEPVVSKPGVRAEMKEGSDLRTEYGRAEVLLNPGVFLRLAENSALRMVSNNLADIRIEFVSGAAVIAPTGRLNGKENWASSISIAHSETTVQLRKNGIYRFDAQPAQLRVYAGEASVTHCAETRVVGAGEWIALANPGEPQAFDMKITDSLTLWSKRRSRYISTANKVGARYKKDSGNGSSSVWPRVQIPLLSH